MARKSKATEPDAATQAPVKKKPFYKRIWFWLLVIVAIIIVASAVSGGDDGDETTAADGEDQQADQQAQEDDAAAEEDEAAAEEEAPAEDEGGEPEAEGEADGGESFTIGDEFEANDWLVTVTNVGERTSTIGDEFLNTEAQGEFLPVDLAVTNNGDSAATFFAGDFVAVDGQDREFDHSSEATMYGASDGAVSLLDEINPGNSIEGTLYFDVPADAEIIGLDINAGFLSDPVRVSFN